ncbi:MAG: hypothetical protein ACOX5T_06950 [Candidatus Cryptobacteroides sp.]|jgi:hypothetical protein|nr:hypothetical protein [Bacteroidota bacterium]NLN98679.1 hypothetical protein [Bacteroidales bacterium]
MKKVILVLAAVLCFGALAGAQPKALGIRFGWGVDLSYEHYAGNDFLEFELGLDGYNDAFHVDGIYNFIIAEPDWTAGSWEFYGGPGVSVAVWNHNDANNVYAGILGNLGLGYTFNIPLQLSLDIRPRIMLGDGRIWDDGVFSFGLGVRYAF